MKKVKSKMEAAGDAPMEDTEPMMDEEPAEVEPTDTPPTGLMARRV